MSQLMINNITFTYPSRQDDLIRDLSLQFYPGWTGIAGPNGSGKTTLLKLAAGELTPGKGSIKGRAFYCAQRTEEMPGDFDEFLYSPDKTGGKLKSILNIAYDWLYRWETLSHGERKRVQVALALWQQPSILALDEPTNHLDQNAREMVTNALKTYQGTGLLVSHDRELMDRLCSHCFFMDEQKMRKGNYTLCRTNREEENRYARQEHEETQKEKERLRREMIKRRESASSADRKRSKRGLALKDHDARAKINLARITGKDGTGGKRLRQMEGRFRQIEKNMESQGYKRTVKTGATLKGEVSRKDFLWRGEPGQLILGEEKTLLLPELIITPEDRIALTGPNGCGKSTLIRRIAGEVRTKLYIPQEISREESGKIKAKIDQLDDEGKGALLAYFSRLGSSPEALLDSPFPSPGETRKLLLSLGLLTTPELIILDEPTNHLDLVSIECLEELLRGYEGALLLVSHDRLFLEATTTSRWRIDGTGKYELTVSGGA